MSVKNLATFGLLLFVAASIAILAIKSLAKPNPAAGNPAAEQAAGGASHQATAVAGEQMVAYYFHGKMRCPTCRAIESYAKEAIETGFAEQVAGGSVRFQVVDYEQPQNRHYQEKYGLVAPSVVLVRYKNGEEVDHKDLNEVWMRVRNKSDYLSYVQQEAAEMLGRKS